MWIVMTWLPRLLFRDRKVIYENIEPVLWPPMVEGHSLPSCFLSPFCSYLLPWFSYLRKDIGRLRNVLFRILRWAELSEVYFVSLFPFKSLPSERLETTYRGRSEKRWHLSSWKIFTCSQKPHKYSFPSLAHTFHLLFQNLWPFSAKLGYGIPEFCIKQFSFSFNLGQLNE